MLLPRFVTAQRARLAATLNVEDLCPGKVILRACAR